MGIGITNYSAMANITQVLYNSLKMNDPKYLSEMLTIKNEKEYDTVQRLFEKLKTEKNEDVIIIGTWYRHVYHSKLHLLLN